MQMKFPKNRILILDELTVVTAFLLSLKIRYGHNFYTWNEIFDGLYVSFLVVLLLLQALIFLAYDSRRVSIFEQDPVDNLLSVIKGKIMLVALGVLFLYAIQRGKDASRIVLGVFFVLVIVFGYTFRMLLRKMLYKKYFLDRSLRILELWPPYPESEKIADMVSCGSYREVLIHGSCMDGYNQVIDVCRKIGVRAHIGIVVDDYKVRNGIVSDVNGFASIPAYVRNEKYDLFGIKYSVARVEEAVFHVISHIQELSGQYICFSNVHTSVMACEDNIYRDVLNGAAFVFPDGKPVAVLQQKSGIIGAERVAGPDFMEHMFRDTQDGKLSHFFYGSTQETLDALKDNLEKRYPGIVIKGMYSPPFRELTEAENCEVIDRINSSEADIVWIGLGAPKQEKWMNAHKNHINGVMMGVGAGFDFHAGTIKRAPYWIQKIGLEWLYRLFQDPSRLFRRYFITNGKFIWYLLTRKK